MIRRHVLEWKKIGFGIDEQTLPPDKAARLAAVARASALSGRGEDGVLEHHHKFLKARGVVGVISTPGCQLEILPKIEAVGETGEPDAGTIRNRLVHMLAVARDIRIDPGSMTAMGWQRDTLLEILIRLFCGKLLDAVRQGMPRRYIPHADDLPTLRGRLDVTRQFSVLAAEPQRLACRYDELSPDIALNQVMKAAISRLTRIAVAEDNQRNLRELGFAYADIATIPPTALPWNQIVLDRTNRRWQELLSLARLLLGDRHQNTSAGSVEGHALLFEMNVLFEEYVARLLRRALAGTDFRVSTQRGHRDCLYEGAVGRFRTRPDIILRRHGTIVLVIDTKWKRMTPQIDDTKRGISQGDVYQLMAYSQIYECDRVMLLYPHHAGLPDTVLMQDYGIAAPDSARRLAVATLDVTAPRSEIAHQLARLVEANVEC